MRLCRGARLRVAETQPSQPHGLLEHRAAVDCASAKPPRSGGRKSRMIGGKLARLVIEPQGLGLKAAYAHVPTMLLQRSDLWRESWTPKTQDLSGRFNLETLSRSTSQTSWCLVRTPTQRRKS